MSALMLDEFKVLFKDEASYRVLIERFRDAMANHGMPLVFREKELLFTAVSPQATQDMLCNRVINRLSEKPGLLDEVARGLKDEIVD